MYIMFYYRYFCFQCFFRAEKALYMGKPDFFGNCFAFFCSGGSDCRLCASPKGTFCFIVYFANIYFDMIELTEKIFFRQQRNAGSCFIFMFACFISRLALIVLRTICAYFLIYKIPISVFVFRFAVTVNSVFYLILNLVFISFPGVSMIVFNGLVLYYVFKRDHLFVLSACLLSAFLKCMYDPPARLSRLLCRYLLRVIGCV